MNVYYLNTSIALRALLGHSPSAAHWIDETTSDDTHTVMSSKILRAEITQVLRRERPPRDTA